MCIAFERIDLLSVVPRLFDRVLLPEGVLRELIDGAHLDRAYRIATWPAVEIVHKPDIPVLRLPASLHRGDRQVISVAHQRRCIALLDDGPARSTARRLGMQVHGTFGLLLAAKRRAFVKDIEPLLRHLIATGFRADEELLSRVLAAADSE